MKNYTLSLDLIISTTSMILNGVALMASVIIKLIHYHSFNKSSTTLRCETTHYLTSRKRALGLLILKI